MESASRSDRQEKEVSKGAGNQAAQRRVAEQSFWKMGGWNTSSAKDILKQSWSCGAKRRSAEMTLKEGMLGLDDYVSELSKFRDDGAVKERKWVSDVPTQKPSEGWPMLVKTRKTRKTRRIIVSAGKSRPNANHVEKRRLLKTRDRGRRSGKTKAR